MNIVRMRSGVFEIENAIMKVDGVLVEALKPLGYRQGAGESVDHAVLGELDPVLQIDIGIDEVGEEATDLIVVHQSRHIVYITVQARTRIHRAIS